MSHVVVYTDGSCAPTNPGPGGWAYLLMDGRSEELVNGSERHSTNNRMEMTAAIEALKSIPDGTTLDLYTDSEYLQKGITIWIVSWKKKNRLTGPNAVKNNDLWQILDIENQRVSVNWHWVRAHNNNEYNERVDKAAREAAFSIA